MKHMKPAHKMSLKKTHNQVGYSCFQNNKIIKQKSHS